MNRYLFYISQLFQQFLRLPMRQSLTYISYIPPVLFRHIVSF